MIVQLLAALMLLPAPVVAAADDPYDVLVFSRTAGFRHDSIAAGTQAIRELGAANGFTVTATEDPATFTAAGLEQLITGLMIPDLVPTFGSLNMIGGECDK